MPKRGSLLRDCPVPQPKLGYDARTSASSDRHALADTVSTAPARSVVSRTTSPDEALPTSTHCPPLLPLKVLLRQLALSRSIVPQQSL